MRTSQSAYLKRGLLRDGLRNIVWAVSQKQQSVWYESDKPHPNFCLQLHTAISRYNAVILLLTTHQVTPKFICFFILYFFLEWVYPENMQFNFENKIAGTLQAPCDARQHLQSCGINNASLQSARVKGKARFRQQVLWLLSVTRRCLFLDSCKGLQRHRLGWPQLIFTVKGSFIL